MPDNIVSYFWNYVTNDLQALVLLIVVAAIVIGQSKGMGK